MQVVNFTEIESFEIAGLSSSKSNEKAKVRKQTKSLVCLQNQT